MNIEVINILVPNCSYSCTTVSAVGYNAAMYGRYTSTPQEKTLNNSWSRDVAIETQFKLIIFWTDQVLASIHTNGFPMVLSLACAPLMQGALCLKVFVTN